MAYWVLTLISVYGEYNLLHIFVFQCMQLMSEVYMFVLLTAIALYALFMVYAWNKHRLEKKVRMQEVAIRQQQQMRRRNQNQW